MRTVAQGNYEVGVAKGESFDILDDYILDEGESFEVSRTGNTHSKGGMRDKSKDNEGEEKEGEGTFIYI